MKRREFVKSLGGVWLALVAVGSTLFLAGCDVVDELQTYVPIGIDAVTQLLNLLGSFGIIPLGAGTAAAALLQAITTAFNDVLADIKIWKATPSSSTLQKVQAELQSISQQLSAFVSQLNIPNTKWAQLVASVLSLILSQIAGYVAGIANKMGATPAASVATARRTITMQRGTTLAIEPKARKAPEFRNQFNTQMDAAGYSQFEIR